MRPYTLLLPKPMLPVGTKPILAHILEWLKAKGITEAIVSTGYLGKMIEDYFGNGAELGVHISYATSRLPLGTAGQLKAAEPRIKGKFVCLYGDALLDFNLQEAIEFHDRKRAVATMVLMKHSVEMKYGFMKTDKEGRLTEWREKPRISGYINVGCYVMEKSFLRYIPAGQVYGMKETFEEAKADGAKLYAVKMPGEFIDIGDRRSYKEANDVYLKRIGKVV